jgi:hypothetical protein
MTNGGRIIVPTISFFGTPLLSCAIVGTADNMKKQMVAMKAIVPMLELESVFLRSITCN